jgi:hypothetical protein
MFGKIVQYRCLSGQAPLMAKVVEIWKIYVRKKARKAAINDATVNSRKK